VDAFFFLSGLLGAHATVETLSKKGNSGAKFWFMYFFHRIWRLVPTYMFVLFFWYKMSGTMGYGPLFYFESSRDPDPNCGPYWWTNLLFINNLVPYADNFVNECMIWSWYIAVDMQLFIIGAPVLALWVSRKRIAIATIIALIVGGTISVLVVTYRMNLSYFGTGYQVWDALYTKPWTRFATYFIGVATGIFFTLDTPKPKGVWWRPVSYVIGAVLILAPIFGTYSYFQKNDTWSTTENALYLAFTRPSFTLGLTLLSFCMYNGHATVLRNFLSADIWGPLSRLTFSAYLIHPVIMYIVFINTENVQQWTPLSVSIYYTAFVVFSYFAAMCVWLLVEKPFMNLEKFWMPPREKVEK